CYFFNQVPLGHRRAFPLMIVVVLDTAAATRTPLPTTRPRATMTAAVATTPVFVSRRESLAVLLGSQPFPPPRRSRPENCRVGPHTPNASLARRSTPAHPPRSGPWPHPYVGRWLLQRRTVCVHHPASSRGSDVPRETSRATANPGPCKSPP